MRIPAEAIPPVTNLNKDLDVGRKAEPVGASGRVGNELSASAQGEPALPGDQPARRPPRPPAGPLAPPQSTPVTGERRQAERRSEKRPVLLDTRSRKGRRQTPGEGGINIKV